MEEAIQKGNTELTPWTVDDLIERAERLMACAPDLFGSRSTSKKELNIRLVRDYVVREFIPRPVRVGRESRFGLDHLVHLLAVRAFLRSEKWSLPAIKASFASSDTSELVNGILAPLRKQIETEYRKALSPRTGAENSPLNAAQQLIEKFQMEPRILLRSNLESQTRMALDLSNQPSFQVSMSRNESKRWRAIHLELESGCQLVIDVDRLWSLSDQDIEKLAEVLKAQLRIEKTNERK